MQKVALATGNVVYSLSRGVTWVGMGAISVLLLYVVADVAGRFLFNHPVIGVVDVGGWLLVIIVFASLAHCASEKGHVRVVVLFSRLARRKRVILDSITYPLSVGIYALISWQLGLRVWEAFVIRAPGPLTDLFLIPHRYFMLWAAIGSFMLCVVMLIEFIQGADT